MSGFQITIIGLFIFLLIIGVLIFAGILPGFRPPAGGLGGQVVLWGTVPDETIGPILDNFQKSHKEDFTLNYVEKDPQTFETDFIEALASGKGPDLIFLPDNLIWRQGGKIYPIPFSSFPKRDFLNTFLGQGELFLTSGGILGLPLYVDPLVLYYNQSLLTNAKIAAVPKTWKEVQATNKLLTQVDPRDNILQSAIALGQFSNIRHAKDILSLLILQARNPIVAPTADGQIKVWLKESLGSAAPPAGEALGFFNRFADPANALYSWNTALPEARDAFLRGNLAMYIGYASELSKLRQQNPQLDFDVALVPQREGSPSLTFGRVTSLAIVKNSRNIKTAYQVATLLSGSQFAKALAEIIYLPPARIDLLKNRPADIYQSVFYQAAITSRGWLDPNEAQTEAIFRKMVSQSQSGRSTVGEAIIAANDELVALLAP